MLRRLSPGRRLALLAALDAGAARLDADATLIVVAPDSAPSQAMTTSAPEMAAACADGIAGRFHSDPALILEMMDNITLAALTIALGFTGDALGFGPGAGQLAEAVATAWERLEDGAPEVLLVTHREATASRGPIGVAARWRRSPGDAPGPQLAQLEAWLARSSLVG